MPGSVTGGLLAAIRFPILERIPIVGDIAISPHGIGIALGFLVGAWLMMSRAEKRGLGHVYVEDIRATVQDMVVWVAVGSIVGARLFYVLTHASFFVADPLSILAVYEGGLSLLGGVTGGVLAGLPFAWRRGLSPRLMMDSAAPGLAAGIAVGRIGDLVIGEHLGAPTDFFLGWRCTGSYWVQETNSFGYQPPQPYPFQPPIPADVPLPVGGCYAEVVHQTALYDFLTALVVLGAILLLERRPRWDGFFVAVFVCVYAPLRFVTELARPDKFLFGLTGSQYAVIAAVVLTGAYLVWRRPWREESRAWDLAFDHPWLYPPEDDGEGPGEVPESQDEHDEDRGPSGGGRPRVFVEDPDRSSGEPDRDQRGGQTEG